MGDMTDSFRACGLNRVDRRLYCHTPEVTYTIPYSRKIWRGIKFGALADRPTDRQIKNPPIFNTRIIRTYVYTDRPPARHSRIIMGVVDLGQAHERELIVDLSCFLTCMLGGVRFYYYLPCRCIDSSPKLACHREYHR